MMLSKQEWFEPAMVDKRWLYNLNLDAKFLSKE
jgi:hypothetical protein